MVPFMTQPGEFNWYCPLHQIYDCGCAVQEALRNPPNEVDRIVMNERARCIAAAIRVGKRYGEQGAAVGELIARAIEGRE